MALEERIQELESRVQGLEDKDAIKTLRYQYCYYIDAERYDDFLSLFTDDATIVFPQPEMDRGPWHGTTELKEFCASLKENRQFMSHMSHNPVITVDGQSAHGKWYFEVPETMSDGTAVWVQGRYEEDYKHVDGQWRIARTELYFNYFTEYKEGWADSIIG